MKQGRILAIALLGIALFALPVLSYPPGRDQGSFATVAQGLLRGQTLYLDVWDQKPPLIYFLYASIFAVAGPKIGAVWLFDLVWQLITAVFIYLLGKQMFGATAGAVAAFGYGISYYSYDYSYLAQTDSFMILPMVAAAYCTIRGRGLVRWQWWLGAGLLLGIAFWFKYTAIVMLLPLGLDLLVFSDGWGSRWLKLIWLVMGVAAVSAVFVAYLVGVGAWGEFLQSIWITEAYNGYAFDRGLTDALGQLLGGIGIYHIGLWVLALVALARYISQRQTATTEAKANNRMLWLWLLVTFAVVLAQRKFFPYHWMPMFAPLALLGGYGFTSVLEWQGWQAALPSLRPALLRTLLAVLMLLAVCARIIKQDAPIYPPFLSYLSGSISQNDYLANFIGDGNSPTEQADVQQQIATYINAHTTDGEHIFVWGFTPQIYLLSHRTPLSRFIYIFPLVSPWTPSEWQREFITDQQATPASYYVIGHDDSLPLNNGRTGDSASLLPQYFPALYDIISRDYYLEVNIGAFSLYRLTKATSP